MRAWWASARVCTWRRAGRSNGVSLVLILKKSIALPRVIEYRCVQSGAF